MMKCRGVLLPLLLLGSILLGENVDGLSVRPRRDLAEQAMGAVMQGAAKIKEALDHGVSLKSEGKRSIDIFGFKFGSNTGVNTGFGDAANSGASENTDDLVRRRRSLDVLNAARAASLMPQSPFGTNVNIVKVSSVSNVNNFGELPPVESEEATATTTVASAARRKRSPDILQVGNYEKKSFSLDSETSGGKTRKTHETLESIRGSNRILVKALQRGKRAPQTTTDDEEEGESSTDQGPPKGRPRGPQGGRPRGPPPGGCRGPPRGPPPDEDDDATSTTTASRRKRDTASHSGTDGKRPKRSPVPCRGGGGKGPRTTVAPDAEVRRKRSAAVHPSMESADYSAESESVETKVGTSALSPARQERRKRLVDFGGGGGGGASGKIGSWFEQMATVFMETVGKVVAATKNAFGRGGQQQQGS